MRSILRPIRKAQPRVGSLRRLHRRRREHGVRLVDRQRPSLANHGRQPSFFVTTFRRGAFARDSHVRGRQPRRVRSLRRRRPNWQLMPQPVAATAPAYVTAIDPCTPDRVYLRVADSPYKLMASDDGGATFRTILTHTSPMLGVASRRTAARSPWAASPPPSDRGDQRFRLSSS